MGKTKNGCAYEALYSSTADKVTKGQIKRQTQAAFRRQIWDGACVDGKLHGFGTLQDTAGNKDDVDALTYRGLLFVNGKHLWAPRIITNLDNYAVLGSTTGYRPKQQYLIGFRDPEYTGFGHFYETNDDGGIEPADVYLRRSVYLNPSAYFRQGFMFRGKRADWIRVHASQYSDCPGTRFYCIEIDNQKMECRTDCREEWDEASASGLAVLGKYLDEEMPKLEATAQASNIDIGGVKAMLAPFVARAEALRVQQIVRRKAEAEVARGNALRSANEAGRLVSSPSLDKLVRQALGAKP